jgi:DNA-binding GntR family transcriptional regulator
MPAANRIIAFDASAEADLKRDVVYERILLDIICGVLRPGESLDEVSLAASYRVGRAGLRDALYRLSLEGLVERRPRLGTIVTGPSLAELEQVFQLRVHLEGQCCTLAARNAGQREINAMTAALHGVDGIIERRDWRELVRRDRAFHGAMAAATRHVWLARTVVTLHASALRFWHQALERRPVDAVRREMQLHLEVAEAIAGRDAAAAETAMRAVLGEFPETVRDLLSGALKETARKL